MCVCVGVCVCVCVCVCVRARARSHIPEVQGYTDTEADGLTLPPYFLSLKGLCRASPAAPGCFLEPG